MTSKLLGVLALTTRAVTRRLSPLGLSSPSSISSPSLLFPSKPILPFIQRPLSMMTPMSSSGTSLRSLLSAPKPLMSALRRETGSSGLPQARPPGWRLPVSQEDRAAERARRFGRPTSSWTQESTIAKSAGGPGGNSGGFWDTPLGAHLWRFKVLYVWAGGSGAYILSHMEKVPGTNRWRFIALSPEQEKKMAKSTRTDTLEEFGPNALPSHHPVAKVVEVIGRRLLETARIADAQEWVFIVVPSEQKNAFVVPGGVVVVFTGLLSSLDSPDALAAVLGHELAHVIARHSAERLSWAVVLLTLDLAMAAVFGVNGLTPLFIKLLLDLPRSRSQEAEADEIGLRLSAMACFRPEAAPQVWRKLDEEHHSSPAAWASSHPSHTSRAVALEAQLGEAKHLARANGCALQPEMSSLVSRRWKALVATVTPRQ